MVTAQNERNDSRLFWPELHIHPNDIGEVPHFELEEPGF